MKLTMLEMGGVGVAMLAGAAVQHTVPVGGIFMTWPDFWTMLGLCAIASGVSAVIQYNEPFPMFLNFVLGVIFGFILAHLIVTVAHIDQLAIYSLAPLLSLGASRMAMSQIKDDNALGAAAMHALSRLFGRKK